MIYAFLLICTVLSTILTNHTTHVSYCNYQHLANCDSELCNCAVCTGRNDSVGYRNVPAQLFTQGNYDLTDFQGNVDRVWLPYWDAVHEENDVPTWGPCFPVDILGSPKPAVHDSVSTNHYREDFLKFTSWTSSNVSNANVLDHSSTENVSPLREECKKVFQNDTNFGGMCRPGFLIIGGGKCGTSSLYQYLTSHPRVLAAHKKQVGFHKRKGTRCYLSNFPTTSQFLSRGALMTGEAYPGYLYSVQTMRDIHRSLYLQTPSSDAKGNGPKILVVVREPLARAYSSYKYNYVRVALQRLHASASSLARIQTEYFNRWTEGKTGGEGFADGADLRDQIDQFYTQEYLFSFEELVRAELAVLESCLEGGGRGLRLTQHRYRWIRFATSSATQDCKSKTTDKQHKGTDKQVPPLVDIELCYERTGTPRAMSSPTRVSPHLAKLQKQHRGKHIDFPETNHLIRSLIGRGLYGHALEWWYRTYTAPHSIHVVCLEDLSRNTDAMDIVTAFLGLPPHNYSTVLTQGRYNVGGNEGYATATVAKYSPAADIPLSEPQRQALKNFFSRHNKKLFERMGRSCAW